MVCGQSWSAPSLATFGLSQLSDTAQPHWGADPRLESAVRRTAHLTRIPTRNEYSIIIIVSDILIIYAFLVTIFSFGNVKTITNNKLLGRYHTTDNQQKPVA